MKLPITGGCLCGAIRYESVAEPKMMIKCHCRDCQRVSGGPYAPALIFAFETFRLTQGVVRHYATPSIGGGHNLRGFCEKCGSRITGAESPERGIIGVLASSLDDPAIFDPQVEFFVADAQSWDQLDETTPKVQQLPNDPKT